MLWFMLICCTAAAQGKQRKIQTFVIEVMGNCDMCKKRIETAALIKGVRDAKWDKLNHLLTVVYSSKVTDIEKVQAAIATAGHDTERIKAGDETYAKLPKCCNYRGSENIH